jgi:hypothetical protein
MHPVKTSWRTKIGKVSRRECRNQFLSANASQEVTLFLKPFFMTGERPMKQVFTLFITQSIPRFGGVGKININDFNLAQGYDNREPSHILLGTVEQEIEVPDMSPEALTQAQIDILESGIQRERADSQVRVNHLLDRISKLKAISHDADQLTGEPL